MFSIYFRILFTFPPLHNNDMRGKKTKRQSLDGKCIHDTCQLWSTVVGGGLFCAKHRPYSTKSTIVPLCEQKRCVHKGCKKVHYYGSPGTKERMHCLKHAPAGMVYIMCEAFCKGSGCCRVPVFGCPIIRKREFCEDHVYASKKQVVKLPGAPAEHRYRCSTLGCTKWPSLYYNKLSGKAKLCCTEHATAALRLDINIGHGYI